MITLKNRSEIAKMRETGRMVHRIIHQTACAIEPGITTGRLEDIAVQLLSDCGGTSPCLGYAPPGHPPYPAWTCISVNEEIVHSVPGRRVIKEGDLVTVDICAELNGWIADSAWTFPVGRISPQAERLLKVTQESLHRGIQAAKAGARTGDIGFAVQRYAESHGFSVVRELQGHGVGRSMHEGELSIPNYGSRGRGTKLAVGMTFAIEPMINAGRADIKNRVDGWTIVTADNSLSAHFEHTIAIAPGGAEILTCA